MNPTLHVACTALLCGATAVAGAQTVYRCGPDGRSYSQQPCPEGRAVPVDDVRSADQRAQSAEAARRDARAADALQRERLAAERRRPGRAIALTAPPAASSPSDPRAVAAKKRAKVRHAAAARHQAAAPPASPTAPDRPPAGPANR